jgi:uncharacterized membrane protein
MAEKNVAERKKECQICRKKFKSQDLMPAELVRNSVIETIKRHHPDFDSKGYICLSDLYNFRAEYMKELLMKEKGELSKLEKDVVKSLRKHEILTEDVNKEFEVNLTFGQKIADKVSVFGGSWPFIISFFSFLVVWIIINSYVLLSKPFDPYPFILLNLVLSCIAAIQAPIIMMSQNRQQAKDRLRAEQDYRVNLKSELLTRHLNQKMDQLLSNQWNRLLEIQQIQIDLMEELLKKK